MLRDWTSTSGPASSEMRKATLCAWLPTVSITATQFVKGAGLWGCENSSPASCLGVSESEKGTCSGPVGTNGFVTIDFAYTFRASPGLLAITGQDPVLTGPK